MPPLPDTNIFTKPLVDKKPMVYDKDECRPIKIRK